jgi:hypothetical protein
MVFKNAFWKVIKEEEGEEEEEEMLVVTINEDQMLV